MTFSEFKTLIYHDFVKVCTHTFTNKIELYLYVFRYLITNTSFKYCFWFRLGSYSKRKKLLKPIYLIAFIMHRHYTFKYGIQLPLCTPIKGGLSFNHFSCIVINGSTKIGENCVIFQGVTIGLKIGGKNAGVPKIGNNCVLGPGCKVLGNVTIGDNVFIGANAVVTHDISSNSIAAGVPAKEISFNGKEATNLVRLHK